MLFMVDYASIEAECQQQPLEGREQQGCKTVSKELSGGQLNPPIMLARQSGHQPN